jgi:TPR repeat protein
MILKREKSMPDERTSSEYQRIETERREMETLKQLRPPAGRSDARAQFNLGRRYAVGEGVVQDHAEAVKWYRKAAEQGYPAAQNDLGWMYQNGRGVVPFKDDAEAGRCGSSQMVS